MEATNLTRYSVSTTTTLEGEGPLLSIQLAYSTADIEKSLLHGTEHVAPEPKAPVEQEIILVVHGEMFVLKEGTYPRPAQPFTEESALFRSIPLGHEQRSR